MESHDENVSSSAAFISSGVQTELSIGDIEQKLPALENENKSQKEKIISMIPIDIARLEKDKEMPLQDFAYGSNTSNSTASRTFDKLIDVIVIVLKFLIKWPNREGLQNTTPTDFVQVYGHKVAVIIDCFEVCIERPGDLLALASTWNNYKHHNTINFLIGICPQGAIFFRI